MYHRGHSNQSIGYNHTHANMKRLNCYKPHYGNVSLSPHSYTNNISVSPRSSSPTLSYELPYQLQLPLSNQVSNTRKNKSKTPKQMQFMSKITEESNHLIHRPTPTPPPHSSPSPIPMLPKSSNNTSKMHRRNCVKKSIQKTRHYSDDINVTNDHTNITIHKPKIINSTSNRSYRKYKRRQTKQKTHKHKKNKKPKHHTSESHELLAQQNKHRNTEKKSKTSHNSKERKKNRAHSTVLSSENNNNMCTAYKHSKQRPETAHIMNNKYCEDIDIDNEYEYEYNYDTNYYESKQSSQDSYVAKINKIKSKQMENRPQTARSRPRPRKSKHNKVRSNGTMIGKSPKKMKSDHIKSHSHGNKIYNHNHNHNEKTQKQQQQQQQKQKQKSKSKTKERVHRNKKQTSKLPKKIKKLNFNEGAMDYMSAEQQLLYLYDYTSANALNRSSASHTTHTTSNTETASNTHTITRTTNTNTNTYTHTSERDGYYEVTSSFSNRRHGNNSDAITPQSELVTCSSPLIIPHRETTHTHTHTHTPHNRNSHSLQFLTSPLSSKYSQLSTRAVTYSPATHPKLITNTNQNILYYNKQHRDDRDIETLTHRYYIENDPALPNLPSPHYLFKLDSHSENDFPITPFNKCDIAMDNEYSNNPTIIHNDQNNEINDDINSESTIQSTPLIVDHNNMYHDSHLLQIPASSTAEESGACYLEGEHRKSLAGMDENDTDMEEENTIEFPTTPPIYRLYINDQQWQDVTNSNPKTPSHRIIKQLYRNSKLQCTV